MGETRINLLACIAQDNGAILGLQSIYDKFPQAKLALGNVPPVVARANYVNNVLEEMRSHRRTR